MAGQGIEREIGEIKACVQYIKLGLDRQGEHNVEMFKRLNEVEQKVALLNKWTENYERDVDRKMANANIKIGIVGTIVAVVSILVSTGLVILFGA